MNTSRILLLNELRKMVSDNKLHKFNEVINFRTKHITVVLENIYQPHNTSAVMRSCDCFGIQDMHIIENNNSFKLNEDIALGSSQWIDVFRYRKNKNNTTECIESLKKQGYKIVATTPNSNDKNLDQLNLSKKTAFVFGTELTGLSEKAIELADEFIKIPMQGFTQSFNISVSAALCLYDATNKLRKTNSIAWELSEEEKIEIEINWCKQVIKHSNKVEKEILSRIYKIQ